MKFLDVRKTNGQNSDIEVSRRCFGYLIFLASLRQCQLRKKLKQPLDTFCVSVRLDFNFVCVQRLV